MASGLLHINCSIGELNDACFSYGLDSLSDTSRFSTVTAVVFWQKMHLLHKHPTSITVLEPKLGGLESEDVRLVVAQLLRAINETDPSFFRRNGSGVVGYSKLLKKEKK